MEANSQNPTTVHVQRALSGDDGSLAWIVARFTPLLVAQARYRLGSRLRGRVEPEDLAQEAWLVLLSHRADIQPSNGRFTPTLLRYLSTTILHQVSNLARKAIHQLQHEVPGASDFTTSFPNIPDTATSVVSRAIADEKQSLLAEAIDSLDPSDREILVLRGIEQHPNSAVSAMLSLTPQAVSMRYTRALDRLRTRLPNSIIDELQDTGDGAAP